MNKILVVVFIFAIILLGIDALYYFYEIKGINFPFLPISKTNQLNNINKLGKQVIIPLNLVSTVGYNLC